MTTLELAALAAQTVHEAEGEDYSAVIFSLSNGPTFVIIHSKLFINGVRQKRPIIWKSYILRSILGELVLMPQQ